MLSEEAQMIYIDEDFGKIYYEFMEKMEVADEVGEMMKDLP